MTKPVVLFLSAVLAVAWLSNRASAEGAVEPVLVEPGPEAKAQLEREIKAVETVYRDLGWSPAQARQAKNVEALEEAYSLPIYLRPDLTGKQGDQLMFSRITLGSKLFRTSKFYQVFAKKIEQAAPIFTRIRDFCANRTLISNERFCRQDQLARLRAEPRSRPDPTYPSCYRSVCELDAADELRLWSPALNPCGMALQSDFSMEASSRARLEKFQPSRTEDREMLSACRQEMKQEVGGLQHMSVEVCFRMLQAPNLGNESESRSLSVPMLIAWRECDEQFGGETGAFYRCVDRQVPAVAELCAAPEHLLDRERIEYCEFAWFPSAGYREWKGYLNCLDGEGRG